MELQQPTGTPLFYDVKAVAEMFHMSRMTVYRAIRDGEIAAVRIRGRYIVPAKVIDALIASAESAAEQQTGSLAWLGQMVK
jgi:excisionase family DNA binding protein